MFVYFNASLYDQKKIGPLVWEPLHYIRYLADGNAKVIVSDAMIPSVLKSRISRLLLTRKADKSRIVATPPLNGPMLGPVPEKPEHVLLELQELWRSLDSQQAGSTGGESISSIDMLKWQLARLGGFPISRGRVESEVAHHLGLTISTNGFKNLLETALGVTGESDLNVLEGKIVYYALTVGWGEKCLVRDALNRFRVDAIYSRLVASEPKVRAIFEDVVSTSTSCS